LAPDVSSVDMDDAIECALAEAPGE
jgi:hypothetical protein